MDQVRDLCTLAGARLHQVSLPEQDLHSPIAMSANLHFERSVPKHSDDSMGADAIEEHESLAQEGQDFRALCYFSELELIRQVRRPRPVPPSPTASMAPTT